MHNMKQDFVFIFFFMILPDMEEVWAKFLSSINPHIKSFQLTVMFLKWGRGKKKERGKGKRGEMNWWIMMAGVCISLAWYRRNEVIIAISSNKVQKMIYRNIYCSHDVLGLEINPYKRYSSVLDQSSSSLARGDDDYWKVNCYVFVWLPVALARVISNSVWK